MFARNRFVAVWVALLCVAGAASAERIRFSKPVVPIATPPRPQDLPDSEDRPFDFSAPPVDGALVQPMPVVRVQPRKKEKEQDDEEAGQHWLMRNPTNFPDATGRLMSQKPLKPEKDLSPLAKNGMSIKQFDPTRSLSPVSDPQWGGREYDDRDESPAGPLGSRFLRSEKNDSARSGWEVSRRDGMSRDSSAPSATDADGRASLYSDVFASRPKEKLTPAQLERRADFERMLNPHASAPNALTPNALTPNALTPNVPGFFNRTTSSLEPVTAMDQPFRSPGPSVTPAVGKVEGRPLDPVDAFNQQQSRLRGPVVDDISKKPSSGLGSPAAASALESRQQTFMRPPATHEFPSRKF